jgi:molybdopterin converting factor small subunit
MRLVVKFYPPFDRLVGLREEILYLQEELRVREFLLKLVGMHPVLDEYISIDSDERQMARMVVVQDGVFLKLDEKLVEGDVLILFPISGG